MKRGVWLALAALVLIAVCGGAQPAGDAVAADSAAAAENGGDIKYVALTFDDGPSPRCTPQLLDGLKERGVRATFFVVGCQVVKDPDIVIRMAQEGHQVGNHSYDHQELDKLSCGAAEEDMRRNDELLQELLGEGDYWVRPPYGLLSEEACAAAATPIINWSVDTEDWKSKDAEKILDIIYRETGDGETKLSVRAVPGCDATAVTVRFGGGGHKGAAGATVDGTLDEAKAAILAAYTEVMG